MNGRTYPPGVPCWIDTTQPDIDAAANFYAGLFGWTFRDATPGGGADRYLVAQLDGADVAGIAGGREDTTAWSTYISVEDADAAVDRLVAAGAVLRAPATDAGEDGRSAALADPEGVEFRLWQPKRQGGAQSVNQPGTWNFSDLHTRSPEDAVGFYQGAFGWQVDKVGFGADDPGFGLMVRLPGYGDHLEATVDPEIRARQSEFAAPPGFADAVAWIVPIGAGRTPHWHVTFAVADRDRTALDAERLGGRVLRQADTWWTREALIQDPQGAVFTASQFTPPTG
ncbi:UNVERIFIED_CONTAM: VOC family protein [Actinomycetes bacterium ARC8]|uniref:VOC family protein n=1 Tax=Pseudarthrobacter oxydans TaxID=1671 RepID=UPI002938BB6D|nr:VOC family protein [Actinomycetes bacterium ARC8]